MVIDVTAKSSCLRHCDPGDKMGLIFHEIPQEYVRKPPYSFMGYGFSWWVTIVLKLVTVGIVVVEMCLSLSRDIAKPHNQRFMWVYGWKILILITHHHAKCGGQCHCSGGGILILVCHVTQSCKITWSNLWVTLWLAAIQGKSRSCQLWRQ